MLSACLGIALIDIDLEHRKVAIVTAASKVMLVSTPFMALAITA